MKNLKTMVVCEHDVSYNNDLRERKVLFILNISQIDNGNVCVYLCLTPTNHKKANVQMMSK